MSRLEMAKSLLMAVLDDDAAAHQACGGDPSGNVIELRNWRGAR